MIHNKSSSIPVSIEPSGSTPEIDKIPVTQKSKESKEDKRKHVVDFDEVFEDQLMMQEIRAKAMSEEPDIADTPYVEEERAPRLVVDYLNPSESPKEAPKAMQVGRSRKKFVESTSE